MYFSAAATNSARRSGASTLASAAPVTPARQTAFQLLVPVSHHMRGLPVVTMPSNGLKVRRWSSLRISFRTPASSLSPSQ